MMIADCKRYALLSVLFFVCLTLSAAELPVQEPPKPLENSEINELKSEINQLSRQLDAVQRDQLNYRIEKDLLREAYSSNLQSINLIITIVFGVFGVISYLGMRSIKEVRADYGKELDALKILKGSFESELDSLVAKQKEFDVKMENLAKINDDQDRRLKVLELIEKANSHINKENYRWALEHVSVGLSIDECNAMLLSQKAGCHGKLGQIAEAIVTYKRAIEVDPDNLSNITNLMEFLSLEGNASEFDAYYGNYKEQIDSHYGIALMVYFRSILALMQERYDEAKELVSGYAQQQPPEAKKHLDNWSFNEAYLVSKRVGVGARRQMLTALIEYFGGKITKSEMKSALNL